MLVNKKISDGDVLTPDVDHVALFASSDGVLKQKDSDGIIKPLQSLTPEIKTNYLLNPYFRINQYGREFGVVKPWEVTAVSSIKYVIDRWQFSAAYRSGPVIASINEAISPGEMDGYTNGLRKTINENYDNIANLGYQDRRYIIQQVPSEDYGKYVGKTLTFSVWIKTNVSVIGADSVFIRASYSSTSVVYAYLPSDGSYTPESWYKLSVTLVVSDDIADITSIDFAAAMSVNAFVIGQYIEIAATQVVEGTESTPHIPREDGAELILCQRFYENGVVIFTTGYNATYNRVLSAYHSFQTPKRIVGTLNTKNLDFVTTPGYDYSILNDSGGSEYFNLVGGDYINFNDEYGIEAFFDLLLHSTYEYRERAFFWEAVAEV